MTLKLLLKILFFAIAAGVPLTAILEHKDIQIRRYKERIEKIKKLFDEEICTCFGCGRGIKYCETCNYSKIYKIACGLDKKEKELNNGNE